MHLPMLMSPRLMCLANESALSVHKYKYSAGGKLTIQGFKRGNLTTFLTDVFTLNSDPIRQGLGMAGLPKNW